MSRIFLLGDSFTDNLFEKNIKLYENGDRAGNGVFDFVQLLRNSGLKDPLHFEDYLRSWGYEVINLGEGGCSIYSIYYQFTKIDKQFREGDRIILNWTSPCRYDWIDEKGGARTFTGGQVDEKETDKILIHLMEQAINRGLSYEDKEGFLKKRMIPFMSYLVNLHKRYKPIVWTPFEDVSKIFIDEPWYFWGVNDRIFKTTIPEFYELAITKETKDAINDYHYGRYGNFYAALVFKELLDYNKDNNKTDYSKDPDLFKKIVKAIKNSEHGIEPLSSFTHTSFF